ncbi:hypothetical protein L6164_021068 [Bauhinia variegata]|uniref:Uncharacterized protein n=1 Tax=Bauhinia variegata TaxID=167791 RepID=A0ACB9MX60_BAUVA|nr:hypothetical protein L6164_021068 [Bauhinia variegata]
MATPSRDAIDTFMRITGSSEFVAVRKLEEYGGNLNEAVNAHFIEGDRHIMSQNSVAPPEYSYTEVNYQDRAGSPGFLPLLAAARRFRPSLLLNPNYRRELRELYNGMRATSFTSRVPSHPGEAREVPLGIDGAFEQQRHSGVSSTNAYGTRISSSGGQEIYGVDGDEHNNLTQSNISNVPENDLEEEMIRAAIEASKQCTSDGGLPQILQEDDDLAHALSLSLKTAEQEKTRRQLKANDGNEGLGVRDLLAKGEKTNNSKWEPGASSNQDGPQNVAQPAMGYRQNHNGNEDVLIPDKWGGISSDELNKAVLLENALFGDISKNTSHDFSLPPHLRHGPERIVDPKPRHLSSSTSESLTSTQLLRQQQDIEYLASLLADKEKELNSLKEAETRRLKEEESRKMLERKESEKFFDMKEVSLPKEPPLDDENAITIVVRMPDGTRCGRRFLRTDKLQLLFDFINNGGALKPGTYRIVKSYPRRAYSVDENSLSLSELGLTSKHEALFLELI